MTFEALPLHDGVLRSIAVDWENARCTLAVRVALQGDQSLVFTGLRRVTIPRDQPWGPSTCINSVRERSQSEFEIEMQSGDVLCILADHWEFSGEAR